MSVISQLRRPKAKSPNRDKPRKFAKDWAPPRFDAKSFADLAHKANTKTLVPKGMFGGKLRSKRKAAVVT